MGRFISRDSFEGDQRSSLSLNSYLYAHSDPINGLDPSGYISLGGLMSGLNTVSNIYTVANISFQFITGNVAGGAMMVAEEIVYSKFGGAFGKRIVNLTKQQLSLFYKIFSRGVSKLRLGEKASSSALRHNLQVVGVPAPTGIHTHHIVGGAYIESKNTHNLLARYDIDVNSAMNGVFLLGCKLSNAIGTICLGNIE